MKNTKKIAISIITVMLITFVTLSVQASILDQAFSNANNFKGTNTNLGNKISDYLKTEVVPVIGIIGNAIFAGVTVILGAKYIWSGVDGKSTVKETLPTFVIAVIFFYLAESLVGVLTGDTIWSSATFTSLSNRIIGTINLVVQYLSFGGILFIGLKYMLSSADGKAKIKDRLVPMTVGIAFVFSASKIVEYIISIGKSALT